MVRTPSPKRRRIDESHPQTVEALGSTKSDLMIPASFFARDPVTCAQELIGKKLIHRSCSGIVIETEAYAEHGDSACHLFTRPSARDFAEANPPGTAYVYLNYGVHWLANVLCHDHQTGHSGFVLLRALHPTEGIAVMKKRRKQSSLRALCSGPGKLGQALAIDKKHHGKSLCTDPAFCFSQDDSLPVEILADRRIGISSARELPWRFLAKDHPGVSVPFGKAR